MLHPIAIPKTIEDYCEAREQAVKRFVEAKRILKGAHEQINKVLRYGWPYKADPDLSVEEFTAEIDRRMWRSAFDKTGLFQYMDANAKREFDASLEKNPPEFTMNNVRTTLLSTAQEADTMFARGLVEFFLSFSKQHKTNTKEPFKVNDKAIMNYATTPNFSGGLQITYSQYGASARINDMDRVFKTLDGKQHHPRELEYAINSAWKEASVYEDEYYQIRGYKKGTLHVKFKRRDLLNKANRLIALYYEGGALAG